MVYAKRPFGGPDAVLAYLSRYSTGLLLPTAASSPSMGHAVMLPDSNRSSIWTGTGDRPKSAERLERRDRSGGGFPNAGYEPHPHTARNFSAMMVVWDGIGVGVPRRPGPYMAPRDGPEGTRSNQLNPHFETSRPTGLRSITRVGVCHREAARCPKTQSATFIPCSRAASSADRKWMPW